MTSDSDVSGIGDLSPRAIWAFLKRQGLSYWLLCFYFFFEYVRPHDIYTGLAVVPWGQLILISCTVSLLFERGRRLRYWTPTTGLLATFTVVILISSLLAYDPGYAMDGWKTYFNWLLVFFLTVNILDSTEKLYVFLLFFLLWSFKMSQHAVRSWAGAGFAFRDWGVAGVGGWFHDSGEMGIQMVILFSLSSYMLASFWGRWSWPKRLLFSSMPMSAIIAVVGTSSRGALLGLVAAVGFLVMQTRSRKAIVAAATAALLVFLVLPQQQIERFEQAGEDDTSQTRLTLWEDGFEIMNRHPVVGVGYDNWVPYYSRNYNRGLVPHNIFVEAGAELGYPGLVVFLLLVGGTFRMNLRTRRLSRGNGDAAIFLRNMSLAFDAALVGYLVCGLFVTVLYYPFFWINLAMSASGFLIARARKKGRRSGAVQRFQPVRNGSGARTRVVGG